MQWAISYQYLYRVRFQWQFCIRTCRAQQDIKTNDHVPQVRLSVRPDSRLRLSENDSPPDTEKFPRLAEQVLRLHTLRLRLEENFDDSNSKFTGEGNGSFSQSNYCASRARPVYRASQRAGWRFRSKSVDLCTNVAVTPHCVVKVSPSRLVTSPSVARAVPPIAAGSSIPQVNITVSTMPR